jgi:hypothetical protein
MLELRAQGLGGPAALPGNGPALPRRLAYAAGRDKVHAADFSAAAADLHARTGRSVGNGSLMRTAPLALVYLERDPAGLMAQAGVLSGLTHADPDAQEACGLWCVAVREAVLTGRLDVRAGLPLLTADRAALWQERSGPGPGTSPATAGWSRRSRAPGGRCWVVAPETAAPRAYEVRSGALGLEPGSVAHRLALGSWVPMTVLPFVAVEFRLAILRMPANSWPCLTMAFPRLIWKARCPTGWRPGPLTSPLRRRHAG